MKVILCALGTCLFFVQVQALKLPEVIVTVEKKACDISIEKCLEWFSKEYEVPYEKLDYIVKNESTYNELATGDMGITCPKTGKPVRSRGIVQLSECWYSHIPDTCAYDAECALSKVILLIKDTKTCKSQWTTCRRWYTK